MTAVSLLGVKMTQWLFFVRSPVKPGMTIGLFLGDVVFDLHACEFLDEWGCHGYSEFSREEFDIPFLFGIVEEHCQRNVAFVPLYQFYQLLAEFR